jgi:formylglycine-generating enzyme required for sulfatase activity
VYGVSWNDVQAYLAWRNARARSAGERFTYDLPTSKEWEKAARGADGRYFPWGSRFDPSLTTCARRKATYLLDAPGGFEPRDESQYGVLDMAGSRQEWTRDVVTTVSAPSYEVHGRVVGRRGRPPVPLRRARLQQRGVRRRVARVPARAAAPGRRVAGRLAS